MGFKIENRGLHATPGPMCWTVVRVPHAPAFNP